MYSSEFTELKRLIDEKGLLAKQPAYYSRKIIFTLGLLAFGLVALVVLDSLWLLLLDAVFLAFVFTQAGFLGHDAGHLQIAKSTWRNDVIGLAAAFLLGMSRSWWVDQHNEHHSNPNNLELDPHTAIPGVAFSEEQAQRKRGIARFLVRYQAYYFFPFLFLEGIGTRIASIQYLKRGKAVKYPRIEPLLMLAHVLLYLGLLFFFMEAWQAILFIVVHQAFLGLYMGSVFAPNHKGMLLLEKNNQLDFLRQQVLTSRNVKAHPLTDFLYGGLNLQIEHHLFPTMPRNKLKEAQKIVRAFCLRRGISYHETTLIGSFQEVLASLHQTSAPLREKAPR